MLVLYLGYLVGWLFYQWWNNIIQYVIKDSENGLNIPVCRFSRRPNGFSLCCKSTILQKVTTGKSVCHVNHFRVALVPSFLSIWLNIGATSQSHLICQGTKQDSLCTILLMYWYFRFKNDVENDEKEVWKNIMFELC